MDEEDPAPGLRTPPWAGTAREVRLLDLLGKYRKRVVHGETDLPFAPTLRTKELSLERLAFQTRGGLKLALRVFFPAALAVFFASFAWDWHGVLRSCAVAGMIGFGTNWIAIRMLFWPRESRPIFGHGLIPSQRDELIDKVAHEVLENLINEELILARVEQTRIVSRFTSAGIAKLREVARDPDFQEDLRLMVLTYVGELTRDPDFRRNLARRAEQSFEDFAGERFRGWMVRRLRDVWRGPLIELLNQEVDRLDETLSEGMRQMDRLSDRLPEALEKRQGDIDAVLTNMLLGLVREVDLHEIVYDQLATVTPEELERGFLEFSDDKLSYITLLGGLFGVIGGLVIVWPLPALGVLVAGVCALAVADVVAYRVIRAPWWPR